jgi:hypothetical protein
VDVVKINPIFQGKNFIRNFCEIIAAPHLLRREIERRMILRQEALPQSVPKHFLILLVPERRPAFAPSKSGFSASVRSSSRY